MRVGEGPGPHETTIVSPTHEASAGAIAGLVSALEVRVAVAAPPPDCRPDHVGVASQAKNRQGTKSSDCERVPRREPPQLRRIDHSGCDLHRTGKRSYHVT